MRGDADTAHRAKRGGPSYVGLQVSPSPSRYAFGAGWAFTDARGLGMIGRNSCASCKVPFEKIRRAFRLFPRTPCGGALPNSYSRCWLQCLGDATVSFATPGGRPKRPRYAGMTYQKTAEYGVVFGVKASFWSLVEAGVGTEVGKGSNRVGEKWRGGVGLQGHWPADLGDRVLKPGERIWFSPMLPRPRLHCFFQCVMPQRLQGTAPRARPRTRVTITRFGRPARETRSPLFSRNAGREDVKPFEITRRRLCASYAAGG